MFELDKLCPETFAYAFGEIRSRRSLTIQELAEKTHYSISQIGKFLIDEDDNRTLPVNIGTVEAIASAMGCTEEEKVRLYRAYACDLLRARGLQGF